jgi:hypothetical protein
MQKYSKKNTIQKLNNTNLTPLLHVLLSKMTQFKLINTILI